MSDSDPEVARDRALVVRRWIAIADRDIRSARACLDAPDPIPETAAYHCQQAAEKLMKGLLVLGQIPFRKTHDLEVLRDLVVGGFPDLVAAIDRLVPLTDWGHVFRYPDIDDDPAPSSEELRQALEDIELLTTAIRLRVESEAAPSGELKGSSD